MPALASDRARWSAVPAWRSGGKRKTRAAGVGCEASRAVFQPGQTRQSRAESAPIIDPPPLPKGRSLRTQRERERERRRESGARIGIVNGRLTVPRAQPSNERHDSMTLCSNDWFLVFGHQLFSVVSFLGPRPMSAPDQYSVVFDSARNGSEWWFPASGLVFVLIGGFLIWLGRGNRRPLNRRFLGHAMAGFACLWTVLVLSKMIPDYQRARAAYLFGNSSVVQGLVTDSRPMPYQGHGEECFTVDSETFCYSDCVVTLGSDRPTNPLL